MSTLTDRPVSARHSAGKIQVEMESGLEIAFPVKGNPRLEGKSPEQLGRIEISPFGLHWPDLDEDLPVDSWHPRRRLRPGSVLTPCWSGQPAGAAGAPAGAERAAPMNRRQPRRGPAGVRRDPPFGPHFSPGDTLPDSRRCGAVAAPVGGAMAVSEFRRWRISVAMSVVALGLAQLGGVPLPGWVRAKLWPVNVRPWPSQTACPR